MILVNRVMKSAAVLMLVCFAMSCGKFEKCDAALTPDDCKPENFVEGVKCKWEPEGSSINGKCVNI